MLLRCDNCEERCQIALARVLVISHEWASNKGARVTIVRAGKARRCVTRRDAATRVTRRRSGVIQSDGPCAFSALLCFAEVLNNSRMRERERAKKAEQRFFLSAFSCIAPF